MRVAAVGSGLAGLAASWMLTRDADAAAAPPAEVELYESAFFCMPTKSREGQAFAPERAFADWLSMTGGSATNGNGGAFASMSEWATQPLLAYRILQDPGAYADTLTL
jgi:hypothetical protein